VTDEKFPGPEAAEEKLSAPAVGEPPRDGFESAQNLIPGPYRIPDATPENMVCLRGPCRHYWFSKTSAEIGNPAGFFESIGQEEPRQHHHVCLLDDSQLKDDCVFECSQWDPLSPRKAKKIEKRRAAYYRREEKAAERVYRIALDGRLSPITKEE